MPGESAPVVPGLDALHNEPRRQALPAGEVRIGPATLCPLEEVFFCKSAGEGRPRNGYAVSNTMGGSFRDGVPPYLRYHPISHPSDSLVFTDRELSGSMCFWPLLRDHKQKKWLWRPWSWPPGLQGMTSRHGNGCNMTFADGHGESIHWKDERTLKLIRGTLADQEAASDQNCDLDYLVRILTGNRPIVDDPEE